MRRIQRRSVQLCLLWMAVAPGVFAADPAVRTETLDEVVIEGAKAQLTVMHQAMVDLEDRFYARYNELNPIDDFDVHCAQEARVGTRLERRHCRVVYMDKALEREAQDYYLFLFRSSGPPIVDPSGGPDRVLPPVFGGPPSPAIMVIEARRDEFRDNMRKVTTQNNELVELLRERYELGQRYEATRRQAFGLKPRVEEAQGTPVSRSGR